MSIDKHRWKLVGEKYFTIERINTDDKIVVTYPTVATVNTTFIDEKQAKENALLISKAPEMLEFLIELYNDKETHSGMFPSQQQKLEQLIKEVTEL